MRREATTTAGGPPLRGHAEGIQQTAETAVTMAERMARYVEGHDRIADPVKVKPPGAPASIGGKALQERAETDFNPLR